MVAGQVAGARPGRGEHGAEQRDARRARPPGGRCSRSVEACPVSAAVTVAMLAVCAGDIAKPNEQPVKNMSSGITQNASDGPARAIRPIVATVPHMPAIISRRGPIRLYSRVVTCTPSHAAERLGEGGQAGVDRGEAEAVLQQQRDKEQGADEPAARGGELQAGDPEQPVAVQPQPQQRLGGPPLHAR